jgi:DUF4097 and DUF4098 domain-containing protein YvlB
MGNLNVSGMTYLHDVVESINPTSGALVVSGGIGVSGNSYLNDVNLNNLVVNNFVGIGVTSSFYALDVNGSVNVNGSIRVKGRFDLGNLSLTDSIETSRLGVGALIVANGGASIQEVILLLLPIC